MTRAHGAPPLVRLRAEADSLEGPEALRAFAEGIDADLRTGAKSLAARCRRRADRIEHEARRLAWLMERRDEVMRAGARVVAGVDEVGVGPLAGPVVAAAVVLPATPDLPGLNDSKKLSPAQRERLDEAIRAQAVAVAIGAATPTEIDRLNIFQAALEAMRRAVTALDIAPDHLLVDARRVPGVAMPQTPIVGGDGRDASIAAASIVAKVHRDAIMRDAEIRYPGYGFAEHKGYGTSAHLDALERRGVSPIHRHSFAPVAGRAAR